MASTGAEDANDPVAPGTSAAPARYPVIERSTACDGLCRLFKLVLLLGLLIVLAGALLLAGDTRSRALYSALTPPKLPPLQVDPDHAPRWLYQNWGNVAAPGQTGDGPSADTLRYHHLPQGTRTLPIPYPWFVHLEQPESGGQIVSTLFKTLFRSSGRFADNDYLLRFGFVRGEPDPSHNPDGLPIGFARSDSQLLPGLDGRRTAVGLTCAACHTGHLNHAGREYVIEGGPANVDLGLLTDALGAALAQTALSARVPYFDHRFDRFARRVLGPAYGQTAKMQLRDDLYALIDELKIGPDTIAVVEGFGRLDALNRIGNQVFSKNTGRAQNYAAIDAPVNYPHIWTAGWFEWVQYDGSIMSPLVRNVGEALGVRAYIDMRAAHDAGRFASSVPLRNLAWIEDFLAGPQPDRERGFAGLLAPPWPDGFGNPDPARVERGAALYDRFCAGCHLPPLGSDAFWDSGRIGPIRYRENGTLRQTAEQVLKLKIIDLPAIGTDPAQARVLSERLADTAGTLTTLAVPAPGGALPPGGGTAAATTPLTLPGIGLSGNVCASDRDAATRREQNADEYRPGGSVPRPPYAAASTPATNDLVDLQVRDSGSLPYPIALATIVQQSIDAWFELNGVADAQSRWRFMGARPNCVQAGKGYKARPLNGVWATAPFLHNGSVPTLYDLLSPPAAHSDPDTGNEPPGDITARFRPTLVRLGNLDFDPVNVGLAQPRDIQAWTREARARLHEGETYDADGYFILDTRIAGNSNRGHEFSARYRPELGTQPGLQPSGVIGPLLSHEQRLDIIEFLKTL
ncbi:MAG: hypothetical protein KDK91_02375 [Gammaproteobacteria bacterium]|nr:hypothetical protein [Gammaproteobacteria bacterium]